MKIINLPHIGDVVLDKHNGTDYEYESIIEEWKLGDNLFQVDIYFKDISPNTIEKVSSALNNLNNIDDIVRQDYLDDFSDEESKGYVDGIYRRILTEDEFQQLEKNTNAEQRLLAAFRITQIIIYAEEEVLTIELFYMWGYEMKFSYKMNDSYNLKGMELEPDSILCKKQFSDFVNKFEDADVTEICSRFMDDWWNHPVKSYYSYHMVKEINKFLENIK